MSAPVIPLPTRARPKRSLVAFMWTFAPATGALKCSGCSASIAAGERCVKWKEGRAFFFACAQCFPVKRESGVHAAVTVRPAS